jgi:hypothetical protein
MKYTFGVFFATALGILTIFSPLFAHHGSSVSYDLANRLTFKGRSRNSCGPILILKFILT